VLVSDLPENSLGTDECGSLEMGGVAQRPSVTDQRRESDILDLQRSVARGRRSLSRNEKLEWLLVGMLCLSRLPGTIACQQARADCLDITTPKVSASSRLQ
jgi:hypothetical protein